MKKSILVAALIAALGVGLGASAQISVGTNGSVVDTLSVLPSATSWSTKSFAGASGDFALTNGNNTVAAMDAAVNGIGNAASTINNALASSNASPPNLASLAVWSTSGYIQTRPTLNAATLVMATLTNASGGSISNLNISYNLATEVAPTAEDLPGHRVYYNLSGAAGAWVPVGNHGVPGPQNFSATLAPAWSSNALMYLLFCDDNASTNNDGAYQIDNFQVTLSCRRIDFETLPDGTTPTEGMVVSNQFAGFPYCMSFQYEDGSYPVIAQVGMPLYAFRDNQGNGNDQPAASQDVGNFFLTDGPVGGNVGNSTSALVIAFSQPVAVASGFILDIDNQEAWDVFARNGATQEVAKLSFKSHDPFTGGGVATPWSFKRPSADIYSVRIKPVGQTNGVGFAFDNLSIASLPPAMPARLTAYVVSNKVSLEIVGTPSATYRIEWSPSPVGGNWMAVSDYNVLPQSFVLPSSPFTFTNLESTTTKRFYRAVGYEP